MTRKTFKSFIESMEITASNIQQLAGTKNSNLSDRVEFKNLEKLDPAFAKKLLVAWEGDAHEYSKKKEFESLFMKMVKPDMVRKMSKIDVNQSVIKDLDKLLALHSQSFHQKEKPLAAVNNDIWSHVGMKRAYESLQAEVESLSSMRVIELFERAKKPLYLGFVKSELSSLKLKLWDKELSVSEIIKILNEAFSKVLIRFDETYSNKESDYTRVGLDGGEFSPSGWITIYLTHDADEVLNGDTNVYYNEFVDLCVALIGHELGHREQALKSLKNLDNVKEPEDVKQYLKDHREMDAYAIQAALELLNNFSKQDVLKKLTSTRELDNLANWSEGLKWYLHTFDTSSPVVKKFLKKIIEIINEED